MVSKIQAEVMFDIFENVYLLSGRVKWEDQYHLHICVLNT